MKKFSLIITAGGTSSRYGNTNKLLEKINDKTVIEETVSKFVDFDEIDEIIISANNSIIEILEELLTNPKIKIIEGGNTRQKSVYNALQVVKNEYVLIHDGARPLIRKDTIAYVLEAVLDKDAVYCRKLAFSKECAPFPKSILVKIFALLMICRT